MYLLILIIATNNHLTFLVLFSMLSSLLETTSAQHKITGEMSYGF